MKKVTLFKSAVLALLVCVGIAACNNDATEVPTEPETYTVKLGWAGEILDVSYEPLTRVSTDDLYGIQVYSLPKSEEAKYDSDWNPYAYGLFDDSSNITITLQSAFKYKFEATMIRDGKNKVYKYDGGYGDPFYFHPNYLKPDNKFYYNGNNNFNYLNNGYTQLIDRNHYMHPNIERFYGLLSDYIPSENSNAQIDMKRTSFGAKFIAKGTLAVDGTLIIEMKDAPKMELALTDGDDQISDVFSFFDLEKAWAKDDYTETIDVTFKRIRTDDTVQPLGTHAITFKRNTTTVVEVNIDKDGNDEGVDLEIPDSETGSLADGNTVTINDGEMQ